ncbi:poly polymerase catalytic domain-containing protein [Cristinia sonorae]|uniref:Poly [ADP-ribose] polymerase n=1 Tax=Cristinia sonorae TaxID=1940300 RepID=A0A8K0XQZ4_9AGAR|nr:poly polymerase catalytic domain-containing protein [Cristinia sonorae]
MPPRKKASTDASAAAQPTRVSARNQAKAQVQAAASPSPDPPATKATASKAKAPASKAKAPTSKAKAPASKSKAPASKGKGKRARAGDEEEDEDDNDGPDAKKAKVDDEDEDDEMDDEPEPPKKMVTVLKRGAAPVDPVSGKVSTHQVLVTNEGVWDAMLNQTDVGKNANKFYVIQLLHPIGNANSAILFTRWGRVGEGGQMQQKGPFSADVAVREFKKQFKAKAATDWENRRGMVAKKGKYMWLERDFEDDDDDQKKKKAKDDDDKAAGPSKSKEPKKIPNSTLEKEVQDLCKLIFSTKLMDAHLSSMNYDANKLPLGKLAKGTILNGFAALKTLSEVISDPDGDAAQQLGGFRKAVEELTGRYYSIIPHVFGRNRPTIIDGMDTLKRELDLVDALGEMEVASKLIAANVDSDENGDPVNPLDANFRSLRLTSMEPLARTSAEFKGLETYAQDTHGQTHNFNVQLLHAYRVERKDETEAWSQAGFDGLKDGERLLLWHGSRTTNFAGILKQGLRIAPPEAPVSGYMFGKGVYFADMMSKSAGYCHTHLSDGTGLLLLCEVAAKPYLELMNADYDAGEACRQASCLATKGLGRIEPSEWQDAGETLKVDALKGCHMPKGKPNDGGGNDYGLWYNEYIVYNTAQIKLKYLLMVKM